MVEGGGEKREGGGGEEGREGREGGDVISFPVQSKPLAMTYLEDSQNIHLKCFVQEYEVLLQLTWRQVDLHDDVTNLFDHVLENIFELFRVREVCSNIYLKSKNKINKKYKKKRQNIRESNLIAKKEM